MNKSNAAVTPSIQLDITREKCPMTFVKTRLLLDSMKPGEVAEIVLSSGEALDNMPESVAALGHEIVSIAPVGNGEIYRLLVRVR